VRLTVEQGAILIGFLLVCYAHQLMLDKDDLRQRLQRFYATMISKKFFAWWVVSFMFWYERYFDGGKGDWLAEYMVFTGSVFCIDVAQKYAGLRGKEQP